MKIDQQTTIYIGFAILLLLVIFYFYNNGSIGLNLKGAASASAGIEGYDNNEEMQNAIADGQPPNSSTPVVQPAQPTDIEGEGEEEPFTNPSTCYPKDQLTPEELLPQDYSSTWAKCNPTGAGNLDGKNFLDAGWHVGINTVGQTLRNANLQLRSEPPNPQVVVSPWSQSSIEPDTNRRYFEVGSC